MRFIQSLGTVKSSSGKLSRARRPLPESVLSSNQGHPIATLYALGSPFTEAGDLVLSDVVSVSRLREVRLLRKGDGIAMELQTNALLRRAIAPLGSNPFSQARRSRVPHL